MKTIKKILCIAMLLLLTASLFACDGLLSSDAPREKLYFEYFDTVTYIYDYSNDTDDVFEQNCEQASRLFGEYHKLFDIYHEYSGINNLCTLNKNAGGEAIALDERLIDFLLYSKELCIKTNNEVNVMMGAVLRLWHDARESAESASSNARLPSSDALLEASRHISIDLIEVDRERGTARISDAEASIDVGALAKGYAAEKVAEQLRQNGADGYVLDVGGNLRLIGAKQGGKAWRTGIRDPKNTEEYAHFLMLSNTSCVTSGDYERYFTYDGKQYHHIIDKDTLAPSEHFSSVTVITSDSGLADALSTALFCMSREEGIELLKSFQDVEVIWIEKNGDKHLTGGLK